jgi:hypothetical protein
MPFAVGAAILGGILAGAGLSTLFEWKTKVRERAWIFIVLCIALLTWQLSVANMISAGQVQIAFDQTNLKMVQTLSTLDKNSKVLFNAQKSEYVQQTNYFLELLYDRSDIQIDYFHYNRPMDERIQSFYVVTPVVDSMLLPSPRTSIYQHLAIGWQNCFNSFLGDLRPPIDSSISQMRWFDFGLNRIFNDIGLRDTLTGITGRPVLDIQKMTYGWEIHYFYFDPNELPFPATFSNTGSWQFNVLGKTVSMGGFGREGDIPLTGDFDGNGWSDIGIYRPSTTLFILDTDNDGQEDIQVRLSNMKPDDFPLVGDWNADGIDTLGFYHAADNSWHVKNQNISGSSDIVLIIDPVDPIFIPLTGDWNRDGFDTFGAYVPASGDVYTTDRFKNYSSMTWRYRWIDSAIPVVDDWYGLGQDTLAYVKNGEWLIRPNNSQCEFPTDLLPLNNEVQGDIPISGRWMP